MALFDVDEIANSIGAKIAEKYKSDEVQALIAQQREKVVAFATAKAEEVKGAVEGLEYIIGLSGYASLVPLVCTNAEGKLSYNSEKHQKLWAAVVESFAKLNATENDVEVAGE